MANDEKIVLNLEQDNEETIKNLPKEKQEKVKKVEDKLREALGVEIEKELARQEALEEPEPEPVVEEEPEEKSEKEKLSERMSQSLEEAKKVVPKPEPPKPEPPKPSPESEKQRLSRFMEKHTKKEENVDIGTFGKYDSDLDFRLNQNIKKVRFPMSKQLKILLSCLAVVLLAGIGTFLGIYLYEEPPAIVLTKVALSQERVTNVYVNDNLNVDYIYLNCEYSDGTTKRLPVSKDMLTVNTTSAVQYDTATGNTKFINSGMVYVTVEYEGNSLRLTYIVEQKTLQGISAFASDIEISNSLTAINLNNKLIVNAHYGSSIEKVDINECTFTIGGIEKEINNGVLEIGSLVNKTSHTVTITYKEFTATFSIYVD